ncbi:MAG: NmrA family NAD(P)-binding protein [Erysipelotrichaceae bacterium]
MKKILITGALGNVGRYVAQAAIKNGREVVVADINIISLQEQYPEATCVYFDFLNPDTFMQALDGVGCVFLMRPPHLGKPKDLQPFIDAMQASQNIELVCFLSLIGIERNPIPPHYKIERAIERVNLPYCHIRPSFFMQNISGVHAFEIKHFNKIVVPVKKAKTSFIDAQDIGSFIAHVFENPQQHQNVGYSITGPEALDYHEVATILSNQLEREITYANPSPKLAKQYWFNVRNLDKTYATVMSMLYLMTRLGTAKKTTATFEALMKTKPTSFETFVKKNLAAWK